MRILITGAHFTPAAAMIAELKKIPNVEIIYVGRKTTREGDASLSVESQMIPKLGVKFIPIITGRVQRAFTRYTIPSLLMIPIGFVQAFYILLKYNPDKILSFGGYVSVPLVIAGWLLSIPIIIHEQTLVTGLANKVCALFADIIAASFPYSKFDKSKTVMTGNPIREDLLNPNFINMSSELKTFFKKNSSKPKVLITGGNQGSHIINITVERSLSDLLKICSIIHQTGDSNFNDYERLVSFQNDHYLVKKFIKDMGAVFSKVDFVISRAGANTLNELAYYGKPTLVIPIPFIYQNEQEKNAAYFKEIGLAQILPQSQLTAESLLSETTKALRNLTKLKESAKMAKQTVKIDAAKKLADIILALH